MALYLYVLVTIICQLSRKGKHDCEHYKQSHLCVTLLANKYIFPREHSYNFLPYLYILALEYGFLFRRLCLCYILRSISFRRIIFSTSAIGVRNFKTFDTVDNFLAYIVCYNKLKVKLIPLVMYLLVFPFTFKRNLVKYDVL